MLSYQDMYEQCQKDTQDYSDAALTYLKAKINIGKQQVESGIHIYHIEDTATDLTEVGVDSYPLPARTIRLKSLYVTVGGRRYVPERVFDEDYWQALKAGFPDDTSDFLQKIFVRRNTVEFYPTPATAGNTFKMFLESSPKDLSQDDYVTGSITTLANESKAVTGSGTTWTSSMVGRVLKITSHPQEFEIASVESTTTLTLVQDYDGISISSGSEAYKIKEVMQIPESTHILPVYYANWHYYLGFKQSTSKASEWKQLYKDGLKEAKGLYGKRFSSKYIPPTPSVYQARNVNPNLYPGRIT